jgi:hypothetical protein
MNISRFLCKKWESGADKTEFWLIDRAGRLVTPRPYYLDIYFNGAGQAVVVGADGKGVIDHTGKEVLPCVYSSVFDELWLSEKNAEDPDKQATPSEALYRVQRNDLWGLYDGTGKELIPVRCEYFDANWSKGRAYVHDKIRRTRGYVNFRSGLTIMEPEDNEVEALPQGFIVTAKKDRKEVYTFLDMKGKPIAVHDDYGGLYWDSRKALLTAKRDGMHAVLDQKTGKPITPFRYRHFEPAAPSLVWAYAEQGEILLDTRKGREYRIGK